MPLEGSAVDSTVGGVDGLSLPSAPADFCRVDAAAPPTLGLRVTVTARTAAGDGDGGGGGADGGGDGDGGGGGGGGGGDGDIAEPGECLKGTRLGGGRQPDSVWSGICPPQTPLPQPRSTSRTVNRTRESRLDPQELIH